MDSVTPAGIGLELLVDEGLGNTTYLLDAGDGHALLIDPPRDLRRAYAAAARRGLRIAWAAETHLHSDFVSGARQLAADHDAQILASAAGMREFGHTGLTDGDAVDLGGLRLDVLSTPGHTDEHLAYVLRDGNTTVGVFTGGCLMVGAAARTDLIDPDRTIELARTEYASIQRTFALGDDTAVWPTHGAGSFCSAPPGSERTSTIRAERATNALLVGADEDTFVARLLAGTGSYPSYFDHLPEINRRGPVVLGGPPALTPLTPDQVLRRTASGAVVVDVRPIGAFGAGHVPGSISNPWRPQFASWLGWLLDPTTEVIIVRDPAQDATEIAWAASTIGFENLSELDGGLAAWTAGGHPTTAIPVLDAAAARTTAVILDVRQNTEHATGHLPGTVHVELGSLTSRLDAIPAGRPVLAHCGHGERAMTAASLLERAGRRDLFVLAGGPRELAAATGTSLVRGR
ncbi:rhodanese-like domain-containing protein [Longispora sp. K20-0274]|uniref:rhodanese-like domain-containing protein n=1 Tax=Longispora sp. K20-0274 TaxID=3088255 RepID=UPI00399A7664